MQIDKFINFILLSNVILSPSDFSWSTTSDWNDQLFSQIFQSVQNLIPPLPRNEIFRNFVHEMLWTRYLVKQRRSWDATNKIFGYPISFMYINSLQK